MKKKSKEQRERPKKELQREFSGGETSSWSRLQGLHSASNPISQKVLSFMGQMIQWRYYCTGRQGENEMKHYHKVTALLGLHEAAGSDVGHQSQTSAHVFYGKMKYDFDNGQSDS